MHQPLDTLLLTQLLPYYSPETSDRIHRYLHLEFGPEARNFQEVTAEFGPEKTSFEPNQTVLRLHCSIVVRPPKPTFAGDRRLLFLTISFPRAFPIVPPHVVLLPPTGVRISPNHPFVTPEGIVRVGQLPMLTNIPSPYSLTLILMATAEEFERRAPFLPPHAELVQQGAVPVHQYLEAAVSHFLSVRLETECRHQPALQYSIARLAEANAEAQARLKALQEREALLVQIRDGAKALAATGLKRDDIDSFLLPADAHSETVLLLSSEIHATNDALELISPLDEAEQKAFVDISKRQFLARYQLHRVSQQEQQQQQQQPQSPQNQPRAAAGAERPNVNANAPLDRAAIVAKMMATLRSEFPQVAEDQIQFNLEAAQYDLNTARDLLKA